MKKIISLLVLFSFFFISNSCKKNKVEPDNTPSVSDSRTLTLESNQLKPYQLVVAFNEDLVESQNVVQGKIGENVVDVYIQDSMAVFMIPNLSGVDFSLKVKINNKDYETVKFSVQKAIVNDPTTLFNEKIAIFEEVKSKITALADTLSTYPDLSVYSSELYDDIAKIQTYSDEAQSNFSTLSQEDKKMVAEVLVANEEYFNDLQVIVNSPSIALSDFFEKGNGVLDVFGKIKPPLKKFIINGGMVGIFGILAHDSFLIPHPVASIVGGVFSILTAQAAVRMKGDLCEIINITFDAISEDFSILKSDLTFESEAVEPMNISTNYVSVSALTNFSSPLMMQFKDVAVTLATVWNKVSEYIPFVSSVPVIDEISTPAHTNNYAVHARYLTVSDISNSNVSLYQSYDEDGVLMLGFKTTSENEVNFTFKLIYSTEIGGFSQTINASVLGLDDEEPGDVCVPPTNVTVSNITYNSADVSWTAGGSEAIWEVVYGLTGFNPNTGTNVMVTSTNYSITGLDAGTTYDVYVRSLCDSGMSDWSDVETFTTLEDDGNDDTYESETINHNGFTYMTVQNPSTGRIWLDRNLGATQVATSSTDAASYGDLYQWGRGTDGHQLRTSGITETLSSSDTPGHGDFITTGIYNPWDWRSPQNHNLWQGVGSINNPCPSGFKVPTIYEFASELSSWSTEDASGALTSTLKLPLTGYRDDDGGGVILGEGINGYYWSSTVSSSLPKYASCWIISTDEVSMQVGIRRANGHSVRCIKD